MSDDFDFDDDEDIDLDDDFDGGDDELAASSSDVAPVDEDGGAPAPAKAAKPFDPSAPVPFFKNWIWWVSLIAAVPALALVVSMVMSALDHGGEWNWVIWFVVGPITLGCAFAATVLPLLLALGFMLGGKEAKAPAAPAKAAADEPADSAGDFDDDGGFDDDDEMFDEDDDEDDFDF